MSIKSFMMLNRKEVVASLKALGIRTGDIIVRLSSTKGPFGIPFSALVAKLSKSEWSHASVIFFRGDVPYVLEVSDRGTIEYRLVDWLDFCVEGDLAVYRYKDMSAEGEQAIESLIHAYLAEDPLYDFTYDDMNKVYCVESVCQIYEKMGIKLCEPKLMSEFLPPLTFKVFKFLNGIVKTLTGKGFDTSVKMYFVGNKNAGLLASDQLVCITPSNPVKPVY